MTDPRSEARARIQRYIDMRRKQPCRQLGDSIHGIHFGTEWRAELLLSDLEAAFAEPAAAMPGPPSREEIAQASAWLRECSTWLLSNDLDMQCPMEADPLDIADALDALSPSHSGETGEVERLRRALIACGRHAGASLADDVSTGFLMHVPEEVRLKIAALKTSPGDGGLS